MTPKLSRRIWRRCARPNGWSMRREPFGGPQAVLAYLSRYTHRVAISNRRLISADETGVTFRWKDYRIDGPGRYQDHDALDPRVHPALPDARAAQGLPPHPPLRPVRQRQPCRQHRAGARVARRAVPRRTARDVRGRSARRTARAAMSLPLLRWPHDHHRDLRARLRAEVSTHTCSATIRIDTS